MNYAKKDFEYHNFPEFQDPKEFANGWFFESEGKWYSELCKKIHNGKILEIGSFEGLSLSYIKDTIKSNNNEIYSVEIYCRPRLIKNTSSWGVNLICKSSKLASLEFPNNFFDLIYIDGEHSYQNVKNDIKTWLPKLKSTGKIAGHDYNTHWPGVVKAVNEMFKKKSIFGRNWICQPNLKLF